MMETVSHEKDLYPAHFERLQESLHQEPSWMLQRRRQAIDYFSDYGFPSPRDEEWKYTDVAPVGQIAFQPAGNGQTQITRHRLDLLPFADIQCPRMVFVNGFFSSSLSSLEGLPEGVRVGNLQSGLASFPEILEAHLGRYGDYHASGNVFDALNQACTADGAFVHIRFGTVLQEPIHVLFLTTGGEQPVVTHPRNLIVAEKSSQAQVVETYLSLTDEVHFTNPVTELVTGDNATLEHYKLVSENLHAFHIGALHGYQSRDSHLSTHSFTLGGKLVRHNLTAVLDGTGADCSLRGLYLLRGQQHVDNHTKLDHAQPHGSSRELYKGILDEQATGVFHGRILVRPGAQKTDSKQTNNNLLLSNQSLVNTKPQLEIYADDVKCTHGATIGQIDKDALFYLRSRGIDEKAARSLLIYAFANDMIAPMRVATLRKQLDEYLFQQLPSGDLIQGPTCK